LRSSRALPRSPHPAGHSAILRSGTSAHRPIPPLSSPTSTRPADGPDRRCAVIWAGCPLRHAGTRRRRAFGRSETGSAGWRTSTAHSSAASPALRLGVVHAARSWASPAEHHYRHRRADGTGVPREAAVVFGSSLPSAAASSPLLIGSPSSPRGWSGRATATARGMMSWCARSGGATTGGARPGAGPCLNSAKRRPARPAAPMRSMSYTARRRSSMQQLHDITQSTPGADGRCPRSHER